jgi:hypothetical protein
MRSSAKPAVFTGSACVGEAAGSPAEYFRWPLPAGNILLDLFITAPRGARFSPAMDVLSFAGLIQNADHQVRLSQTSNK